MGPVIVMGVSGCAKTSVGAQLAQRLGLPFIEGDRLLRGERARGDDEWLHC